MTGKTTNTTPLGQTDASKDELKRMSANEPRQGKAWLDECAGYRDFHAPDKLTTACVLALGGAALQR